MKRSFSLILVFVLILSLAAACGKGGEPAPEETREEIREQLGIGKEEETQVTEATEEPEVPEEPEAPEEPVVPEEPEEPEAPEEPEEPEPVIFINPLTGEETQEDLSLNRPYAMMIDNVPDAMPQDGISAADILIEATVEGQPTRTMGIFLDITRVEKIGGIRSARGNFVDLAAPFDPFYVHEGGSEEGLKEIKTVGIIDVPAGNAGITEYFPRDNWRSSTVGYLHSVVAMTEEVAANIPDMVGASATREEPYNYGFTFAAEPQLPDSAEDASGKITVRLAYVTTEFAYDAEKNLYFASHYGGAWVDHSMDNTQLSFRNVLTLYMKSGWRDSHRIYTSTGEGEGTLFVDGKAVTIKWARESVKDPFTLTYEDGTPVELGVGKTYIGIITDQGYTKY